MRARVPATRLFYSAKSFALFVALQRKMFSIFVVITQNWGNCSSSVIDLESKGKVGRGAITLKAKVKSVGDLYFFFQPMPVYTSAVLNVCRHASSFAVCK